MKKVKEAVPMWRVRLLTLTTHPNSPPEIRADVKAALDEIDHLKDALRDALAFSGNQ